MAPSSGWYPDPAGAAALRYWDGQTWTRETSALPAAPAPSSPALLAPPPPQQPIPQQPIPQQPIAPAAEGFTAGRALPGSRAGSVPVRTTMSRYGTTRTRNATFYGLIAGGVAVVVAAAFAVPPLLSSGHKPASTTVTQPQPVTTDSPAPAPRASATPDSGLGKYHLPDEFAGYPRLTDAGAARAEAEVMRDWPVTGAHDFGIYGDSSSDPVAMIVLQSMALTPAGDAALVRGAEKGLNSVIPGLTWQTADAGDYGGALQCGTTTQGNSGAVCVFADASTFGFTFVMGSPSAAGPAAVQFRAEAETTPPTPQPTAPDDPSQTSPQTPPQTAPDTGSGGGQVA